MNRKAEYESAVVRVDDRLNELFDVDEYGLPKGTVRADELAGEHGAEAVEEALWRHTLRNARGILTDGQAENARRNITSAIHRSCQACGGAGTDSDLVLGGLVIYFHRGCQPCASCGKPGVQVDLTVRSKGLPARTLRYHQACAHFTQSKYDATHDEQGRPRDFMLREAMRRATGELHDLVVTRFGDKPS